MATKLEHTVSYPFSTDRLWEVVTTEQYWRDLLDAMNHDKGVLESFSHDGDTVTVIKDLKVKGSSSVVKVGTKVKNIRIVEGDHDIDCKIEGFGAMQLKSEFVKKA